tara:strand:- start:489 stop:782 length:294 start_codon:yes stop_codon:yes gene_type:complete
MKEKEIRPKKLFKKFLNLAYLDAKKYFKGKKNYINCVACNKKGIFTFKKNLLHITNVRNAKLFIIILDLMKKFSLIIIQNQNLQNFGRILFIKILKK